MPIEFLNIYESKPENERTTPEIVSSEQRIKNLIKKINRKDFAELFVSKKKTREEVIDNNYLLNLKLFLLLITIQPCDESIKCTQPMYNAKDTSSKDTNSKDTSSKYISSTHNSSTDKCNCFDIIENNDLIIISFKRTLDDIKKEQYVHNAPLNSMINESFKILYRDQEYYKPYLHMACSILNYGNFYLLRLLIDNMKNKRKIYLVSHSIGGIYSVYIHIILTFFFKYKNLETYVYGGLPIIPTHLIDRLGKLYYIINQNDIFCSLPSLNYSLPKQDHIYGLLDEFKEANWLFENKRREAEIKLGYTALNFFTILSKNLSDYKLEHIQDAYKKKIKQILLNYFTSIRRVKIEDSDKYFTNMQSILDKGYSTDFFIYLKIISIFKFKIIFDIFETYFKNINGSIYKYKNIYDDNDLSSLRKIVELIETYRDKFKPHIYSTPILDIEKYKTELKTKAEIKEAEINEKLVQKKIIEENNAESNPSSGSLSGIFTNLATIVS
jgi:hypothetical protein